MKKESLLEQLFFRQDYMLDLLQELTPYFKSKKIKIIDDIDEVKNKLSYLKNKNDLQSLVVSFDITIKNQNDLSIKFKKSYEQIIETDIFNDSILQKVIVLKFETLNPIEIENINIENQSIFIQYVKKSTYDCGISYSYSFYNVALNDIKKVVEYLLL
ncbi:hypothetical protein [Campylobacter sp. RM12651]|uniref:hypothetical protein n=1 Tax=Campylobacter sp. RM12651 TaxID=1660079 RepID=UPI001EFB7D3A|nr:hypothetical protein [Campylobacter sp. RM12651]ULO03760.1 hypothetical protein AVBRAN_1306 [Campylobacter sp. RM12651]